MVELLAILNTWAVTWLAVGIAASMTVMAIGVPILAHHRNRRG